MATPTDASFKSPRLHHGNRRLSCIIQPKERAIIQSNDHQVRWKHIVTGMAHDDVLSLLSLSACPYARDDSYQPTICRHSNQLFPHKSVNFESSPNMKN